MIYHLVGIGPNVGHNRGQSKTHEWYATYETHPTTPQESMDYVHISRCPLYIYNAIISTTLKEYVYIYIYIKYVLMILILINGLANPNWRHVSLAAKTFILQQTRHRAGLHYHESPTIWRPLYVTLWRQGAQVAIYYRQYLTMEPAKGLIYLTCMPITKLCLSPVSTCSTDSRNCIWRNKNNR